MGCDRHEEGRGEERENEIIEQPDEGSRTRPVVAAPEFRFTVSPKLEDDLVPGLDSRDRARGVRCGGSGAVTGSAGTEGSTRGCGVSGCGPAAWEMGND